MTTWSRLRARGAEGLDITVAVIGAGFTGLSAARTLARRGARVAVLEAETIGWGASSRNGGMVLTGLKLDLPAWRVEQLGQTVRGHAGRISTLLGAPARAEAAV